MAQKQIFLTDNFGKPIVAYHGTYYDFDYFFPLTHFGTEQSANTVLHEGKWKRDKNIDINKPKIIPVHFRNGNYLEIPDLNDHYVADWEAVILALLLDKTIIDDINKMAKWDLIERKCKKVATKSLPYHYDFICEPVVKNLNPDIIRQEITLSYLYDEPTNENLFFQRMIIFLESAGIDGFVYPNYTESGGQNSYIIFRQNNVIRLDKKLPLKNEPHNVQKLRKIESAFEKTYSPRQLLPTEINSWIKKLHAFYDFKITEMARQKQKGKNMLKIPSIKSLEDALLKDSTLDDVRGGKPDAHVPEKRLTANDVRHDIAVLARYLIRVYVGWPVHDDIVKRKVLTRLTKLYKSAHNMTASELFESLTAVIEQIPDNHISLRFNGVRAGTKSKRKHKDVGKNFAGKLPIKTELRKDGVAVIGFNTMLKTDEFRDAIINFQTNDLPKSKALIIDLRHNGGGNSRYSDDLARFLCGADVDSMKKTYVRTTPEAMKVQAASYPDAPWSKAPASEKLQLWKTGKCFKIDKKKAYMKPIFILTDERTGSSAEMFLLRMVHHPMVTVIGDNSAGMEVYGNMCHGFLPHSNITVSVGMNYRILEHSNLELHGYKPNIKCNDGTNAMDIALAKLDITKTMPKKKDLEK